MFPYQNKCYLAHLSVTVLVPYRQNTCNSQRSYGVVYATTLNNSQRVVIHSPKGDIAWENINGQEGIKDFDMIQPEQKLINDAEVDIITLTISVTMLMDYFSSLALTLN